MDSGVVVFAQRARNPDQEIPGKHGLARRLLSLTMPPDLDDVAFAPFFDIHAADPDVGRTFGGYRLIRLIGYGGMGKVFLAERADLERLVAFKIARGSLRGEARRRVAEEGKIHARLEHPNIATLYDAGTIDESSREAGRPFFAMEYVDGQPIDEYCQTRHLDVRGRLAIFLRACAAVEYAHRQPVVHLDLKPGNILVTAEGEPKLLDFGIARLLASEPEAIAGAGDGARQAMTFQYASPEQVRGDAVSVASDVYSLGVVLYKLLAGRLPFELPTLAGVDEVRRSICEIEPPAPSTAAGDEAPEISQALSGDLDQIVLKALAKDPRRRYGSVRELADDVRRHLDHRPVLAVDGGAAYKLRKLVRRHRLAVAVSALFVVLVLGAVATTTVLWQRSERALARAERASQFLEDLIRGAGPNQSRGEELTVRQLLEHGRRRIPADLGDEPELRIDMAGTFGEVLRELGDHEAAGELLEEALEAARRFYRGDHAEVVKRLSNVGTSHLDAGRFDRAEQLFRDALEMAGRLGQEPMDLVRLQNNLASALLLQGRFERAEELYLDVLRTRREHLAALGDPDDPDTANLATSHRNLGGLYFAWGEPTKAETHLREALAIRLRLYGRDDTRVAAVLDLLGSVVAEQGRRREAETIYDEALRIRRDRLGENHPQVAWTKKNLAELLLDEAPATARVLLSQALEVFARSRPDAWQRAEAESLLGAALLRQGQVPEAESCLRASWETLRELLGEGSVHTERARRRLAELDRAARRRAGGAGSTRETQDPQTIESLGPGIGEPGAGELDGARGAREGLEGEDDEVGLGLDDLVVFTAGRVQPLAEQDAGRGGHAAAQLVAAQRLAGLVGHDPERADAGRENPEHPALRRVLEGHRRAWGVEGKVRGGIGAARGGPRRPAALRHDARSRRGIRGFHFEDSDARRRDLHQKEPSLMAVGILKDPVGFDRNETRSFDRNR